jgi:hypothetical protein
MHDLDPRKSFTVITGGGRKPSAWIDIPQTVIGKSPHTKDHPASFRIATEGVRKALDLGHRQPLLDLWSLVFGRIPPVNGAEMRWGEHKSLLKSFDSAYACFRGIRRPVGDDDKGFDMYAYVTLPALTFRYTPSMACVVEPVELPSDIVCVIYVKMDYPLGRRHLPGASAPVSRGVVTHWELVEADESGLLPMESETRYRTRMW